MSSTEHQAAAADATPVVQVVAAVILRGEGEFLLAQRPPGKVYAGYWEFPGGKIEAGEEPAHALARELHEELGIEVRKAYPWITRRYTYAHATVDLNFFRVTEFEGEPHGRESQALAWQRAGRVDVAPMLPANGPILGALELPSFYAITDAGDRGVRAALAALERALARGLRLVQVREPALDPRTLRDFATEVVRRARSSGARVLVNADAALARAVDADGIHLKSPQLRALRARPDFRLVGASCHDAEELALAQALGADFAVLGPVAPTPSHPDATPLGWTAFGRLVRGYPLPVYGLGGLGPPDLESAWSEGAHGIAMQRAAWAP